MGKLIKFMAGCEDHPDVQMLFVGQHFAARKVQEIDGSQVGKYYKTYGEMVIRFKCPVCGYQIGVRITNLDDDSIWDK